MIPKPKPNPPLSLHFKLTTNTTTSMTKSKSKKPPLPTCSKPYCFFCAVAEPNPQLRLAAFARFFQHMPRIEDEENVLVMSSLWSFAMTRPDHEELPSAGVFRCMALLIHRGLSDPRWLRRHQNLYIPYYAAHAIGSYTISVTKFAELAVEAGVVLPLVELMRGREFTWVEQRVAVRALGHLASYDETYPVVAIHQEELINLCMDISTTCLLTIHSHFISIKDRTPLQYQCDLLTRGLGGREMENHKAEEWASQLQCWSLYLLGCFASKNQTTHAQMCQPTFLKELSRMWGGVSNDNSPAGVGLVRILCRSQVGRNAIARCNEAVESLCNLSRSSDDWQYMGIDCLLMLLRDSKTRDIVGGHVVTCLVDLVELTTLGSRNNVGHSITEVLLHSLPNNSSRYYNVKKELEVVKKRREECLKKVEFVERRQSANLKKKRGNELFRSGDVKEATKHYSLGLEICPWRARKTRTVIYSNRAQCRLFAGDYDGAISDATRALSLSSPANSHGKSLWRRSQAYDMKGLAKESLMDCVMFVKYWCMEGKKRNGGRSGIPYYAARMISKQMSAIGLFAGFGANKCGV